MGIVHKGLFEWAALRVFESRYTEEIEDDIEDTIEIYNDIMRFSGGTHNIDGLADYEKLALARKAERVRRRSNKP